MKLFSNEIVFRGHPDKVCDQISDAILDECLSQDKYSRCGIEVMGGKSALYITGEITTCACIDIEKIAKRVLHDVGYPDMRIIVDVGRQSYDIAMGTNNVIGGAGDNGMMFGYACNDTPELLPTAMIILQRLSRGYDALRIAHPENFKPDGKAQITGVYDDDWKLVGIDSFTICYQNAELHRNITDEKIKDLSYSCMEGLIIGDPRQFFINPTGRFEIGGFIGDAGLTGRKIVVDSYHGFAPVGGGAFSGKDPTKVDRSGAYKARQLAKRMLKEHNLRWCKVQLSYSIGLAYPMAIYITSDGGDIEATPKLYEECTPSTIISDLNLLECKYEPLAAFGHFVD